MKSNDPIIKSTNQWFLESGIQNINIREEVDGAFNSWFDIEKEDYYYAYSEITGYGITTLIFLDEYFDNLFFMKRANLAANWIKNVALTNAGGIKTRDYFSQGPDQENYSFDSGIIYSFDTGMVLNGLINLYRKTENKEYLEMSIKVGDFLIEHMQKPDGSFYAYYNPLDEFYADIVDKWSTQSGSFHSKIAIGLIDLYEATTTEKYKFSALKVCDYALEQQESDGRFISFRDSKNTHLHPHSYTVEGLLYVALKLGIDNYIESCVCATEWALDNQLESGGISPLYIRSDNRFSNNERTDVLAQTLRLGIYLLNIDKLDKSYEPKIEKLYSRLISFQETKGSQKGGFRYGIDDNAQILSHVNSWCTMFTSQALILYGRYMDKKEIEINFLI